METLPPPSHPYQNPHPGALLRARAEEFASDTADLLKLLADWQRIASQPPEFKKVEQLPRKPDHEPRPPATPTDYRVAYLAGLHALDKTVQVISDDQRVADPVHRRQLLEASYAALEPAQINEMFNASLGFSEPDEIQTA